MALVDVAVAISAIGPATAVTEPRWSTSVNRAGTRSGGAYPPLNESATRIGKANRRTDTRPETRPHSCLHRRGMRCRKDFLVRAEGLRVRSDSALCVPGRCCCRHHRRTGKRADAGILLRSRRPTCVFTEKRQQTLVQPRPYVRMRHTPAQWWFADEVHRQISENERAQERHESLTATPEAPPEL